MHVVAAVVNWRPCGCVDRSFIHSCLFFFVKSHDRVVCNLLQGQGLDISSPQLLFSFVKVSSVSSLIIEGGAVIDSTKLGGIIEGGASVSCLISFVCASDMFSSCQSLSGEKFGPQLRAVCELFRLKSPLVTEALATLVVNIAKDSSLQATFPFTFLSEVQSVVSRGSSGLVQAYDSKMKLSISGIGGQPIVATLLDDICSQIQDETAAAHTLRSSSVRNDSDVVLNFLDYCCSNVLLSYPPEMRERLVHRLATEGWCTGAVNHCGEHRGSGEEGSGSESEEPSYPDYDTDAFLRNGIHMPLLRKHRERGVFHKDAKSKEESASGDGGCDKAFDAKKNKTGPCLGC
jgi:hypothetical protein